MTTLIKNKFDRIKYWFYHRFHPKHRYNILRTKLPPDYYDPDVRILYGCMETLADFWEVEKDERLWEDPEHQQHHERLIFIRKEILEILEWWKLYKDFDENGWKNLPTEGGVKLDCGCYHNNTEDTLEEQATEMLIRLMKIRPAMWH